MKALVEEEKTFVKIGWQLYSGHLINGNKRGGWPGWLGWAAVGSDPDQRITGNQSSSAAAAVILSKHPAEGGSNLTSHFDNP